MQLNYIYYIRLYKNSNLVPREDQDPGYEVAKIEIFLQYRLEIGAFDLTKI
jgi:hypothetical protein